MTIHTGSSYEGKAQKYAEKVDTSPWNMYYERPAVLSLLPSLENVNVLDVGCGSGWYTEQFLERGATVTSFDFNADFVALTASRVEQRATVFQFDLSKPLDFAMAETFDVIVCSLVMHYLQAWEPVFCEFHRVLKPNGVLIFSTHHPFADWKWFDKEDYFKITLLEDEWKDFGKVTFYRRPLTTISHDLMSAGSLIERLLEPHPTEEFRRVRPDRYEHLTKNPHFIVIRAVRSIAASS